MRRPNQFYRTVLTAPRVARVAAGVVILAGGVFGFLPVLGFWMIPLGILVIFFDVPWVRNLWWRFRPRRRENAGGGDSGGDG